MSFDTLAGIYVYCMDYHSGQNSRLYRLMSRIRARLSDDVIYAIQGNRHTRNAHTPHQHLHWQEWESARTVYRKLKRRKAQ